MPTSTPRPRRFGPVAAVVIAAALSACSSGSSNVVRTPTAQAPSSSSPSSSASTTSAAAGKPAVKVTPATGLQDKQIVLVNASGFSPNEALQVIECADKGTKTGAGDCNLSGMLAVTSDATGNVRAQLRVLRGPFGGNKIVCGSTQHCLVSVTEASLAPTEEADRAIEFAPA
ncbi:MAG TPA: neocarzinostatin apoprotein domain-containing protein [Jatrophihabitantaceae bacterium]|nr:neocarzinostatin apoprotein domain-containing protein [Jatrophihabitantaceae bacterium]